MLALLFFCLLAVIAFPLKFTAGVTADFNEKSLSVKMRFYDIITVTNKKYRVEGLSVTKNGEKTNIKPKPKKVDIKSALKLYKLRVMLIFDFRQAGSLVYPFGAVLEMTQAQRNDRYRLYIRNIPEHKMIAAEGIIYTCFANIIFAIIKSFGVRLWNLLKTKLKK